MASSKQVLLLLATVAAAACLPPPASAKQWMVGDDGGWRPQFNQTGWANNKTFVVGDTLMFMYPQGKHTVAKVGKEAFAACDLNPSLQLGNWSSGNDVVTLKEAGKAWFICTVPTHCTNGMKLVIDVVAATAPAPSPWFPSPPSEPNPAMPPASPPSAAVRYPVGGALAAAAATVVAAALAF